MPFEVIKKRVLPGRYCLFCAELTEILTRKSIDNSVARGRRKKSDVKRCALQKGIVYFLLKTVTFFGSRPKITVLLTVLRP